MEKGIIYDLASGHISGTNNPPIPTSQMLPPGIGQIIVYDDINVDSLKVDVSKFPPVLINNTT